MERVYWNDEWNQPEDNGNKEEYKLVIWDITSDVLREYTLEEYNKLIDKNDIRHTK